LFNEIKVNKLFWWSLRCRRFLRLCFFFVSTWKGCQLWGFCASVEEYCSLDFLQCHDCFYVIVFGILCCRCLEFTDYVDKMLNLQQRAKKIMVGWSLCLAVSETSVFLLSPWEICKECVFGQTWID